MYIALSLAVVIVIAIVLIQRRRPRIGEVLPANVMKRKYGLTAENRPEIHIDPKSVPESLRDLIPVAEKWGIGDDIIRCDVVDRATEEERREFQDAVRGRMDEVTAWLGYFDFSCEEKVMSDDVAAFMFMQTALDEMGLWTD